jgi:peptidoglycan/xylan/chitin deacetylase (PgdA/CDA1 family)
VKASTLMYHDVEGPDGVRGGFEGSGPAVYAVTDTGFRAQMDAIERAAGRPPLTADALVEGRAAPGPWLLTFDDGGSSAARVGAELAERSWPAHFFVVTDRVGTPGFLSWDEIEALARQGHVIGSHSASHPAPIADCSEEELLYEWSASVGLLSEAIGAAVTTASVPGGYYSPAVGRAAAVAGISCLFTSEPVREVRRVDGHLVVGRYAVRRGTSTEQASAAAAGRPEPWLRQRASWELRGVAKRVAGRHYRRLRTALLDRR